MEKKYWIGRKRSALAMARGAASAEARLIHYELAGRYSIKAAQCLPFVMRRGEPKSGGQRAVLHLPDPAPLRSAEMPLRQLEPPALRSSHAIMEESR
jgi:hypothetical protein